LHKLANLFFILLISFCVSETVKGDTITEYETLLSTDSKYYIEQVFAVYDKPSFIANIVEIYAPQEVQIIKSTEDGWGLIKTYSGDYWICLNLNRRYISWVFAAYDEPNFKANIKTKYLPQEVKIVELKEDGWGLINTYAGEYWVYLKQNMRYINKTTSLFNQKDEKIESGAIAPQTVKIVEDDEEWLLIETSAGKKWLNVNEVRISVLLDVPSYNQQTLGYFTGCEIVSLGMMINFQKEVDTATLVSKMPLSNDPNIGFVGNPKSKNGFTIFPTALKELTEEYMGNAKDMTGCEISDLKEHINDGHPIVVWVNGLGFNVHAICLTGYTREGFYYNDPWTGMKSSFISYEKFYSIWDKPIENRKSKVAYPTRLSLSYE